MMTAPTTAVTTTRGTRDAPAWRKWSDPLLVIAVVLALWQTGSALGWLQSVRFPAPTRLAHSLWELITDGYPQGVTLGTHFAITMQRIVGGFLIAVRPSNLRSVLRKKGILFYRAERDMNNPCVLERQSFFGMIALPCVPRSQSIWELKAQQCLTSHRRTKKKCNG